MDTNRRQPVPLDVGCNFGCAANAPAQASAADDTNWTAAVLKAADEKQQHLR